MIGGFGLAAALAIADPAAAQAPSGAIREAALAEMSRLGIPGLTLAVAEGGSLVHEAAFGFADVENGVRERPQTVYRLASVSKPMTAVAVLRLAERGVLDLDAPVWRYCPDFPDSPSSATIRWSTSRGRGCAIRPTAKRRRVRWGGRGPDRLPGAPPRRGRVRPRGDDGDRRRRRAGDHAGSGPAQGYVRDEEGRLKELGARGHELQGAGRRPQRHRRRRGPLRLGADLGPAPRSRHAGADADPAGDPGRSRHGVRAWD